MPNSKIPASCKLAACTPEAYYHPLNIYTEPNRWKEFGYHIAPEEHAADFTVLKELIEREKPAGQMIVGPDVAGAMNISYFEL